MAHIVSLPLSGQPGAPKFLHSDDPELIARWIKAEDRPGFGVYDILNPLVPGATRHSKENMRGVLYIFIDIDAKDVEESAAEVEERLHALRQLLKPTWINNSGHGWHVIYELKEEVERGTDYFELAIVFQEQLVKYLAGDPGVRPWSLLRRPGTTNFKREPYVPCYTTEAGTPVDITEIETLCNLLCDRGEVPLLTRKSKPGDGNGHDRHDPLVIPREIDARLDISPKKPPVDVDARLAAMRWHGAGDSAINVTQRDVMGSLLRHNVGLQEATVTVLEATRRCVAGDPAATDWDWHKEELDIAFSGARLVNKHPDLLDRLPDSLRERFEELATEGKHPSISRNADTLFVRAMAGGRKDDHSTHSKRDDKAGDGSKGTAKPATPRVTLQPFRPIDEASLPPRRWLYGRHYQRGVVSATVAPGGTGKTSLVLVEAVALATGRNLLGEQPEERCRVWLHNGDDSRQELDRRTIAICKHYGIPQEELQDWLFLTSGAEMPLKVANGFGDLKVDTSLIEEMTLTVMEHGVDVVLLDPLVTLHSVNESDNGKMDTIVRIFTRMANACDCSVDLSHHTRKLPSGVTGDHIVDDARGASSVRDAVRTMRVLNIMSREDAGGLRLDEFERLSYFRVDRGKSNSVAPAKSAIWRKFENVSLANGDEVGVVTPWEHPTHAGAPSEEQLASNQVADAVFLTLLDKFNASGRTVGDRPGPSYAPARFAEEKEAALAKLGKSHLKNAMQRLFDAGNIVCEEYGRPDRPARRIKRNQLV